MALAGHIADFPLAELLFFLSSKQRTGQIVLKRPMTTMIFTLRRGRLIAGQMLPADQRLGDRLVAEGFLNAGLLAVALEVQRQDTLHRPLGTLLVELGYVEQRVVMSALRGQIADCLFRFLIAPGGTFTFREKLIDPRRMDVDINVEVEVLEAIRRADEWIAGRMDTNPIYLNQQINADVLQTIVYERWGVVEAMLDGATTIDEIVTATGWERERVIDTVLQFQAHGAIDLEAPTVNQRNLLVPSQYIEEARRRERASVGAFDPPLDQRDLKPLVLENASSASRTGRPMISAAPARSWISPAD
ncbi:MAG TPA: DUF4388 domain-containing protein [Thermomicrobiales bacterium]|nr:DUF4388 domain-containing protein [Thermomicrobiales bacterium]